MFRSRVLWWILLIFWITGSLYWHVFKIEHFYFNADALRTSADSTPVFTNLRINTPDLHLSATGNISFARSKDTANFIYVKKELDSLATYLSANPAAEVTITGDFHPDETNPTLFRNLGLARAISIRRFFLRKGISDSIFTLRSRLIPEMIGNADSVRNAIELQVSQPDTTTTSFEP